MKTLPKGLIILIHNVLENISHDEIISALPESYHTLDMQKVPITPAKAQLGEMRNFYLESLKLEQEKIYEAEVKPLLDKYPDYQVVYFGLAPVPLAIHLGHKIGSLRKVEVYQKHHLHKDWIWRDTEKVEIMVNGEPKDIVKNSKDVILRTGTRFRIDESETTKLISQASKEIEFYPAKLGQDIFSSSEELEVYASCFGGTLDSISTFLPDCPAIHLFAALPVGLAFLLGQQISPNAHTKVHVYQFAKDEEPNYAHCFIVNEDSAPLSLDISADERKYYSEIKEAFEEQLKYIKESFILDIKEEGERLENWFEVLDSSLKIEENPFLQQYWKSLSRLDKAPLQSSFIQSPTSDTDSPNSNRYYYYTDQLFKILNQSLKTKEELLMALRLFCFHETIRQASHELRSESTDGMIAYPRIMEEVNYQADVYSLLHEFFREGCYDEAGSYFKKMIHVLTETMWAFDKGLRKGDTMEVQRINRYLSWYYLLCRLETGNEHKLEEVLELLGTKPLLELRLQALQYEGNGSLILNFKDINPAQVGICVFHEGKIKSYGNIPGELHLQDLILGLKNRQSDKIKEVLHALIIKLGS